MKDEVGAMARPAVVLLSGGLDSATAAAIARSQGFDLYALTVDYGQRHCFELEAARRVANAMAVRRHVVVGADLRQFGGSALTDQIAVPKDRSPDEMRREIPVTYVPARNTVFLALALAYAEVVGADDVFIGVNAVDYSGYPDCRPEFFAAMQRALFEGSKLGRQYGVAIAIETPVLHLSKARIVRLGLDLGAPLEHTWSCYEGGPVPCGACDSCLLRARGFAEAGAEDPLLLRLRREGQSA